MSRFLRLVAAFALIGFVSGCQPPDPPYPNAVPIDTTGNFGAR